MYCLDLKSSKWTSLDKSHGDWPLARDDHSACFSQESGCMYIFGGYVNGSKSNDLWKFDTNTHTWTKLQDGGPHLQRKSSQEIGPCNRIGASLVQYNNSLYLFGGHDEMNEKINDFWKYNLLNNQWHKIEQQGAIPHVQIYNIILIYIFAIGA